MNSPPMRLAALERALAAKLQELLASVPGFPPWKVDINPAPSARPYDLIASAKSPHGTTIELYVECKSDPRPSRFPYVAIEREFEKEKTKVVRAWVFAAPHISPRMAQICEEHHWSWFDLAGNCKITVPTFLHIERHGLKPIHEIPRPAANLSTPEAGRVIRALLAPENANRPVWTQRAMLQETHPHVSLGLVNKVVRHLRNEAFVEEVANSGFRLRDPLKLLFAWRDAYRFDRHERRNYFTLLKGNDQKLALFRLSSQSSFAAYAAFSAADFQASHVRQPKTWLFVRGQEIPKFERLVEAKPVESGENVVLLVPNDDGVFSFPYAAPNGESRMRCTNPVQTYVDCWHAGGRGEEAAEAILEQRLKPQWRDKGLKV